MSLHEGQNQRWLSVHSSVPVSSRKRVAEDRGGTGWDYRGNCLEMRRVRQEVNSQHLPHARPTQHPKSGTLLKVQSHSQDLEPGTEQVGIILGLKILMS